MDKNFKEIFNGISDVKPPEELRKAVLNGIKIANETKMRREKTLFGFGITFSMVSFIFCCFVFGQRIATSDFYNFVLLGFSDAKTFMANWQDFGMTLLETFPTVDVALVVAPVLLMFLMMKAYVKSMQDLQINLSLK